MEETHQVSIVFYGIAKEISGTRELKLPFQPSKLADVRAWLVEKHPAFKDLKSLKFAVNEEYRDDNFQIDMGDEVVVIPPVSGG